MKNNKSFRHLTSIQIRFNDLDILGHVNNAVYQHYFDIARLEYYSEVIGKEIDWEEFSIIMGSISIEYFKPIKMGDEIAVRSKTLVLGEKSMTMAQEIYDIGTGEVISQNRATMVGFSAKTNETVPIPALWREKIFEFEEKVEHKYPA